MKKFFLITIFFFILLSALETEVFGQSGGVTIGEDKKPHKSAILDLESSNKGFLPPRLTSSERKSIKTPAAGLIVYDSDLNQLYLFDGVKWKQLATSDIKTNSALRTATDSVAIDSSWVPPFNSTNFDSSLGKLLVSDGNVWRDPNTGCLPSYLKKINYTHAGSNASTLDPSGNIVISSPNQPRRLYEVVSGKDLGYAVEANDSNYLYQSEVLNDQTTMNGSYWNNSNVSIVTSGTLASRPRFLITKTDNQNWSSYRKLGLKLDYNTSYFCSVIIQKKTSNFFRIAIRSDGGQTEGFVTVDLNTGDISDGGVMSVGTFSNVKAIPLKGTGTAWIVMFNFIPSSQGSNNTTHQLRLIPFSTVIGDAVYVSAPFLTASKNTYSSYVLSNQVSGVRGQELLKLDLGLQSTGTVLVKSLMNDQVTRKNRAVTWKASSGTGLNLDGNGFDAGYAIAENGVLVEAGGKYSAISTSSARSYYIDPSALLAGDGTMASPFNSFKQLPVLSGDLNGTKILIKRGTKLRETLRINLCSNFTLDSYGSGALPIIDGSDTTKGNWIQEGGVWFLPNQDLAQTYFINDIRSTGVSSKDKLINTVGSSWYDIGNKRIYINVAPGIDPNTQLIENTNRLICLNFWNCTNFIVRNIQFQRARDTGFFSWGDSKTSNNSIVERCISIYNGAFDLNSGLAGDGFCWYGFANNSLKGRMNQLRQCISIGNINCAYEFAFQDSLRVEDNYASRNGNGFELWGYVTNSTLQRNRIFNVFPEGISWGHGNGLWIPNSSVQQGVTGGQDNNKISSNLFASASYENIIVEAGSHEFNNNLFFDPSRFRVGNGGAFLSISKKGGVEAINVSFRNNIFYQPKFKTTLVGAFNIDNTVSTATLDNNYYYSENGSLTDYVYKGTVYGNFLSYKNGSGQDAHNSVQVDPKFSIVAGKQATGIVVTMTDGSIPASFSVTDEITSDFHLSTSSPAVAAGDSTVKGSVVGVDFAPYGTSRPVGPYAVVTGSPISLGDLWINGANFRGGSLEDVQVSTGSLPSADALVKLTTCK